MIETKKQKAIDIIISIILAIIGILLIKNLEPGIKTVSYVVSGSCITITVLNIVFLLKNENKNKLFNLNLIYAVVALMSAIFLIINPTSLITILKIIISLWIIINSSAKLQKPFTLKRHKLWYLTLILPILSILIGFLIVFNPINFIEELVLIGTLTITYSVINIITIVLVRKIIRKLKKEEENI